MMGLKAKQTNNSEGKKQSEGEKKTRQEAKGKTGPILE